MFPPRSEDEPYNSAEPGVRGISNVRSIASSTSLDAWLDEQAENDSEPPEGHPLDNEQNRKLHARLRAWFEHEMELQAPNRYQMALDADFYDSLQWSEEDAEVLMNRGQAPLVFNQIKPTIDWLIGTEKRTRVDFKVLPREEDDEDSAEAKTKLLKYESDVNKTQFARSRAFADMVKSGMGILEDAVRADPTKPPLYSRYVNWRQCLHDSAATELDGSDARFFFRWQWVDLDIAEAIFPDRVDVLRSAAIGALSADQEADEDFYYMGAKPADVKDLGLNFSGRGVRTSFAHTDSRRERVRLIECWYRVPTREKVLYGADDDALNGVVFDPANEAHNRLVQEGAVGVFDRVSMKVHVAVMTEDRLLQVAPSPYKHDRFPFTILWGYRRGRDNMPYGAIRAIRDPQEDLNKRVSKSLHILSTKQVIMERGAVDDLQMLREEVAAPDGVIVRNPGKDLIIQRDDLQLQEQIGFMERDAMIIRETGGVTSENLGRDTNASSGRAILAKQDQGSVVTTELFDNLLLAFQLQGELQLSLIEQYYTEAKVLRVIGNRGNVEWLRINQPDDQGRVLNDITRRKADFIVAEQDYRASVRMAMFETMAGMIGKLSPEVALQLLDLVVELGDVPNKEEVVKRIRKLNGQLDPGAKMTPEEMQAAQAAQAQVQEAQDIARAMAQLEMQAKEADIRKKLAEAAAKEAEAAAQASGAQVDVKALLDQQEQALQVKFVDQLREIQAAADREVSALAAQLQQVKLEAANKQMEITARADNDRRKIIADAVTARMQQETDREVARIEAQAASNAGALMQRLDALEGMVDAQARNKEDPQTLDLLQKIEDLSKQLAALAKCETRGNSAAANEAQPINLTVNVDAAGKPVKKTGRLVPDGKGGYIVESQETETKGDE